MRTTIGFAVTLVVGCGAVSSEGAATTAPACVRRDPQQACAGVCGPVPTGCPGEAYECACAGAAPCVEGRCVGPSEPHEAAVEPGDAGTEEVEAPVEPRSEAALEPTDDIGATAPPVDAAVRDAGSGCSCSHLTGGASRGRDLDRQRYEAYRACVARCGGCGPPRCPRRARPPSSTAR